MRTVFSLLIVATTVLLWTHTAYAVNCDRNPNHAQCTNDGGGGSGGETDNKFDPNACQGATGTYPAVAFNRTVISKSGRVAATQVWLADSTGSCALPPSRRFR